MKEPVLVSFKPTPPDALQKLPKKGLPSTGFRLSPVLVGVGVFVGSTDVLVGVFVGVLVAVLVGVLLVAVFVGVCVGVFFGPSGVLVGVLVAVAVGVLVGIVGNVGSVCTAGTLSAKLDASADWRGSRIKVIPPHKKIKHKLMNKNRLLL